MCREINNHASAKCEHIIWYSCPQTPPSARERGLVNVITFLGFVGGVVYIGGKKQTCILIGQTQSKGNSLHSKHKPVL